MGLTLRWARRTVAVMDLITIFHRFPDDEACIEHLERVRWDGTPRCPNCNSQHVARKNDGHRMGRWNCHDCKSSFNVLSGTIMSQTRIPLQKWFLAIGWVMNAERSISSPQLARDLDLTQQSALYLLQRIRDEMTDPEGNEWLSGIIEIDDVTGAEALRRGAGKPKNRRRGTHRRPALAAVERDSEALTELDSGYRSSRPSAS